MNIIEKDLLDPTNNLNFIIHCCNCQNTMGSGIAAQIKAKYPEAYRADTESYYLHHNNKDMLGTISCAKVADNLWVINLYGQLHYGPHSRQINYEAFYTGLEKSLSIIKKIQKRDNLGIVRVGFPYKIGCDRAGGNWNIVSVMIDSVFNNNEIEVIIHKLPK